MSDRGVSGEVGWISQNSQRSLLTCVGADIDECVESVLKRCAGHDEICVNTRGGHFCETVSCPAGFVKAPRAAPATAHRHRFMLVAYSCLTCTYNVSEQRGQSRIYISGGPRLDSYGGPNPKALPTFRSPIIYK